MGIKSPFRLDFNNWELNHRPPPTRWRHRKGIACIAMSVCTDGDVDVGGGYRPTHMPCLALPGSIHHSMCCWVGVHRSIRRGMSFLAAMYIHPRYGTPVDSCGMLCSNLPKKYLSPSDTSINPCVILRPACLFLAPPIWPLFVVRASKALTKSPMRTQSSTYAGHIQTTVCNVM